MVVKIKKEDMDKIIYWYDKHGYYYGFNTIKDTMFILGINKGRVETALNNRNSLVRKKYLLMTKRFDEGIEGGYRNKYKGKPKRDKIDFPLHAYSKDGHYLKTYTNYENLKKDVKNTCICNIPRSINMVGRSEDNRIWTNKEMPTREEKDEFGNYIKKYNVKNKKRKSKETKSANNGLTIYSFSKREDGEDIYIRMADCKTLTDFCKIVKLKLPKQKIDKLQNALPYKYGNLIVAPRSEDNIFIGNYNDSGTFKL